LWLPLCITTVSFKTGGRHMWTTTIPLFFVERTTLDECVSIDIAEKKYKDIALGDHNQEKGKKNTRHQQRRVGL